MARSTKSNTENQNPILCTMTTPTPPRLTGRHVTEKTTTLTQLIELLLELLLIVIFLPVKIVRGSIE